MKHNLIFFSPLLLAPLAALHAAGTSADATLESRGLPRILFNNDSDDLKWPAYPQHHDSVWVPAGKPIPLPSIRSPEDYLALRIGPLAKKTEVAGRHELTNGFKIVYEGNTAGCVLFHGDYMYSDYDLMSVTRVKDALGHGVGDQEDAVQKLPPMHAKYGNAMIKEGKLVGKEGGIVDASNNLERIISRDFSDRTGIQMIQHGAQVNYAPRKSKEMCHAFVDNSYYIKCV